jgi:hypothetical protein
MVPASKSGLHVEIIDPWRKKNEAQKFQLLPLYVDKITVFQNDFF